MLKKEILDLLETNPQFLYWGKNNDICLIEGVQTERTYRGSTSTKVHVRRLRPVRTDGVVTGYELLDYTPSVSPRMISGLARWKKNGEDEFTIVTLDNYVEFFNFREAKALESQRVDQERRARQEAECEAAKAAIDKFLAENNTTLRLNWSGYENMDFKAFFKTAYGKAIAEALGASVTASV